MEGFMMRITLNVRNTLVIALAVVALAIAVAPIDAWSAEQSAGAPATTTVDNPYGLEALWAAGDFVSRGTLGILFIMSLASI